MKTNKKQELLLVILLLIGFALQAQVKKSFTPRYNSTITGDVTMVANNVLSRTATTDYNDELGNHDFVDNVYVDIDNDATTFNSSSANLVNPKPNDPCLEVDKVLLYWAAADKGLVNNGIEDDNQPGWDFDDVKLMLPGQTTYTTVTADEVIYRGRDENPHVYNDPYVCVKDITNEVNNLTDPFGKYQVANVEAKVGYLISHNGGTTGTSGGWQVILVYKSDQLKPRNITLFDGYAHVSDTENDFDINISGFQTVPNGNVKSDVVIGALEGDRDLTGDRLQILNTAGVFQDITAPLRDADNFFNSRITIGPSNGANNFTDRSPASLNTLGFDAALFPLSNQGNSLLTNNQTSTTFRLTSDQETYGLFALGFSVEIYQPSLETIFTVAPTSITPVSTAQTATYTAVITNTGNDNANNVTLTTIIPVGSELVQPITGLPSGVTYTYTPGTRTLTFTVVNGVLAAGESLTVEFDTLINDNCYYLLNGCSGALSSNLAATYNGELNVKDFTSSSSNGIDACGVGNNLNATVTINPPAPATWVTSPQDLDRDVSCDDATALSNAQSLIPVASCSGLTPIKTSGSFVQDAQCPSNGTYTNTWNFTDACGRTIANYVQTITVLDTTAPSFTVPADIEIFTDASCNYDVAVAETGDVTDEDDNCSTGLNATFTDSTVAGSCEGTFVITRTWSLVDDCGNNAPTQTQTITVSDNSAPSFTAPADIEIFTDASCNYDTAVTATGDVTNEDDNCSTGLNATFTDSSVAGSCEGTFVITRTWSLVDDCGNAAPTQTQTITVSDNSAPSFTAPADITINCEQDPSNLTLVGDVNTETDNCDTTLDATYTDTTATGSCPNESVITRTWTLTDDCNNTTTHVQTITIEDTTPPTFVETLPTSNTVDFDSIPDAATLTATDNCGTANVTFSTISSGDICTGSYTITRTWTATDACDLTTIHTQVLTVTQPVLEATITSQTNALCGSTDASVTVTATGGTGPYTYLWNDPSAQATATATNLVANTYNVIVTDVNDCTVNIPVTITNSCIAIVKSGVFNDEDQDNCTDVGETISYTFTVTNTGNASLTNLVITDPLLEAPNPVVAIVLASGDTDGDNQLDPTETWTYTADYTINQNNIDTGLVTNQATVTASTLDSVTISDISGTTATTDDATVITLCTDEDIALVKAAVFNDEDQDNCTDVGETISYTFTVTNTGNVSIDNIVLSDPLLEAPNPVVAIAFASGDTDGDNQLDPTETWTYTADYTVTQTDIDAAQVTNQATVNGQNVLTDANVSDLSGTTATTDDATVITLCQGDTTIALVKAGIFNDEDQDNCTDVGETISYTFTVTNTGNVSIDNIVLTDPLLEAPNPVVAIAFASGDTDGDNQLDPTETWTYTADYTVTQTDIDAAQVTNQATVNGQNVLTDANVSDLSGTTATTDDATVITLCQGDTTIALVKAGIFNDEDQDNCTDVGETISYTFTVTNTGNVSIDNIVLTDPLLEAPNPVVAIVFASGDTDGDNQLDPTETWTYTADYTVTQTDIDAAQVTNQATVNGQNVLTDANVSDLSGTTATTDDATVITLCQGDTTIALVKAGIFNDEDQDNCTDVGETISYTFTVTNTGNVSIDNIVLTDPLLEAPNPVVAIAFASGDTDGDNQLDPTETWTYTADYTVTQTDIDAAQVTNQATVNGQNVLTDANVSDLSGTTATTDDATVITLCQGDTTIALVKAGIFNDEDQDNCTDVGETISYTFTVTNTGNVSIDNIVLSDPLLEAPNPVVAIAFASGDTDGDNQLDPTETWTYTADYTVTQTDIDAAQVTNQATVNGQNVLTDANVSDLSGTTATTDDATVITLCQGDSSINVVKTSEITNGDPCLNADSLITYTFTVTNTGNISITIASINDALLGGDITASVTLVSGDTNTDGLLNPTETWVYTAPNYTVTQADYDAQSISNTVTINGADVDGTTVTATDTLVIGADQFCDPSNNFAVVKTSEITNGDPCLNADSLVTYTFTVTNTGGNSSITIASINDALLGGDITASVTLVSGDTNTDGLLNPTETWVYTAPNYTVTQADYDAQSISNTVTINGADVDGTTVTATDTLVIGADQFCDPSNNFAVVKTSEITNGDPCLNADSLVTYTFTVTNTGGNSSITIASINDALLGGDITASVTLVSGDTNTDGLLNPTETWVYTAPNYTVTQADYDAQSISNTVTINGADVDGTTVTATDTLVIGADQFCDPSNNFAVVKTSEITNGDPCLNADSLVTYTFTVTNTGGNSSITIASINDALLGGDITASVTLVSGDTNTDGLLNPTETWVYTAPNYTVTQADYDAQSISNTVTINGADVDGTTVTATDTLVIGADQFCDPSNNFAVVKTSEITNGDPCLNADSLVTYTFTVTNTGGNSSITIASINDALLGGDITASVTLVSGDTNTDGLLNPTETWVYTAPNYTVTQVDYDAQSISNTVTINGADVDGTTVTATDTLVIGADQFCDPSNNFAVVKTSEITNGDPCLNADSLVTYTFTVTNTGGNSSITIASINDALLGGDITASVTLVSGDTNTDGLLNPTETWVYTAPNYTVTQADYDAQSISNTVTINGADVDGTTVTATDTLVIGADQFCDPSNNFAVVKTSEITNGDPCLNADSLVTYTFTVTNTGGNSSITIASINDALLGGDITASVTLVSGDTNTDGLLNPTETWVYTAPNYTVTQVDYDAQSISNTVTINGADVDGTTVTATDTLVIGADQFCDPSNNFAVVKTSEITNGDPCLNADSLVTYTFTVTNTGGNSSITIASINDALLGGDITASVTLVSGDTNTDGLLNPTETWVYTAPNYTVTQADYDAQSISNTVTINGADVDGTTVTATDTLVIGADQFCDPSNNFAVVKTSEITNGDPCLNADSLVTYTFTVTNTGGNSSITIASINDALLGGDITASVTLVSGDTNTDGLLNPTETWVYTAPNYTVTQADYDAQSISNTVTINGADVDGTTVTATDTLVIGADQFCDPSNNFAVVKTSEITNGDPCLNADSLVTYTFTVTNTGGNSSITIASINDALLGGDITASVTLVSGDTNTDGLLNPTETWVYTAPNYTVTQADYDAQSISNTVTINGADVDGTTVTATDTLVIGADQFCDPSNNFAVVKTSEITNGDPCLNADSLVTYTFTVTNTGGNSSITIASINDALLGGDITASVTLVSGDTNTDGLLNPTETWVYTAPNYTVTQADYDAQSISNTVTINGADVDGTTVTATDTLVIGADQFCDPSNNFAVVKTSEITNGDPCLNADSLVTYTFTVTNTGGNSSITIASINDALLGGDITASVTLVSGDTNTDGLLNPTETWVYTAPNYTVTQADYDAQSISNTVTINGADVDGTTVTATDTLVIGADQFCDPSNNFAVVKTSEITNGDPCLNADSLVTYTFTVTNTGGNSSITIASINDALLGGDITASVTLVSGDTNTDGLLNPTETWVYTAPNYTVTQADYDAQSISNTVTINGADVDGTTVTATDTLVIGADQFCDPSNNFAVVKTSEITNGDPCLNADSLVTYTFTVTNTGGNSSITIASINDALLGGDITASVTLVSGDTNTDGLLNPTETWVYTAPNYTVTQVDYDAQSISNTVTINGADVDGTTVTATDTLVIGADQFCDPSNNFAVVKTSEITNGDPCLNADSLVTYTFTVTNTGGNSSITIASINDALLGGDITASVTLVSGDTNTDGLLNPTETWVYTAPNYTVTQADYDAQSISNTVTINGADVDGTTVTATDTLVIGADQFCDPSNNFAVVKTSEITNGDPCLNADSLVTYTFTVTNTGGNSSITIASINDALLGGDITASVTLVSGDTNTDGLLNPTETWVYTAPNYTVTQADYDAQSISNTVTINGTDVDGTTVTATDTLVIGADQFCDPSNNFAVVKTSEITNGDPCLNADSLVTYTFTVTNTGGNSSITIASINDALLGGDITASVTLVSGDTNTDGLLNPTETWVYTAPNYTVTQADYDAQSISNTVTINGTDVDGTTVTATDTLVIGADQFCDPSNNFAVVKTSEITNGDPCLNADSLVTYTFTVTNTGGNSSITIASINDALLGGDITASVTLVSGDTNTDGLLNPTETWVYTAPNYTVTQADYDAQSISNTVTINGADVDGTTVTATDTLVIGADQFCDPSNNFAVVKTSEITNGDPCLNADSLVTYTFTVTNTGGNSSITIASINDALLGGDITASVTLVSGDTNTDGLLNPTETWVYTAPNYTVTQADYDAQSISNTVTINGADVDGTTVTATDTLVIGADQFCDPSNNFAVVKTSEITNGDPCLNADSLVTYTFTVTNTGGNSSITIASINDALLGGDITASVTLVSGDTNTDGLLNPTETWVYTAPNYTVTQADYDAQSISNTVTINGADVDGTTVTATDTLVIGADQFCDPSNNFAVVKTSEITNGDPCLNADSLVTYTFTVTNTGGNSSITIASINDALLGGDITASVTLVSGDTNTDGLLNPTETWVYTAPNYTVTQADYDAQSISNTVTINGADVDGTTVTATDTLVIGADQFCDPSNNFAVVKTSEITNGDPCLNADSLVTYTFTVTNTGGNSSITIASINDALLGGDITASVTLVSGDTNTDGLLNPTETWVYTAPNYTVTQADYDAQSISNTVTINGADVDGTTVTATDTLVIGADQFCDPSNNFAVVKTSEITNGDPCLNADSLVTYTFTVTNTGGNSSITIASINDALLGGDITASVTLVSGDTNTDGLLNPTETWVYTAPNYTVTQADYDAQSISNTVTINGADVDGTTVTATDTLVIGADQFCDPSNNFAVVKTSEITNGDPCLNADSLVTYTFTVTNTGGNSSITIASINDALLGGDITASVTLVSGDTNTDGLLNPTETWVYTAPNYTVTQADYDAQSISNTVTINGADVDGTTVTATDTLVIGADQFCDPSNNFAVVKTSEITNGDPCLNADSLVTYTFTVTNTGGNSSITIASINDALLGGDITASVTLVSGDTNTDGLLNPTETWVYTAPNYTVTQADYDAQSISNTVTINGADVDGTSVTATDTLVIGADQFCDPSNNFAVVKTSEITNGDPCLNADSLVTYTFTVTNTGGNSSITIASINDALLGGDITASVTLVSGDTNTDGLLNPTETWVYTAPNYTVTQADYDAQSISNTVTINGADVDGTTVTATDTLVIGADQFCDPSNNFAVVKTSEITNGDPCLNADSLVTYTFTVTNTGGNSSITIASINDALLGGDITASVTLVSGDTNTDGLLNPTETWVYTAPNYTVTQADYDAQSISNTVTINGADVDGTTVTATDTLVIGADQFCDPSNNFAVVKTSEITNGDPCLNADSLVTYTFTVTNTGGNSSITIASINDALLGGDITASVTLVSGDTNTDGLLNPTETWVYTAPNYTVTQADYDAQSISNTVTINGADVDGTTVTATDTLVIGADQFCDPSNNFAVVKTSEITNGDPCLNADSLVTYTFTVTNTGGNSSITIASINDALLGGDITASVTLVSGDTNTDGLLNPTETWVYTAPNYTVTQADYDAQSISNTVTINGADVDGTTVTATDTLVIGADQFCDPSNNFAVVKTSEITNGDPCLNADSLVTYTFTVTNTGGNSSITIASINDALLGGDITASVTLVSGDTNTDGLLNPTETWVYTAPNYTVTQADYDAQSISNTVTINGADVDGTTVTATDTLVIGADQFCDPSNNFAVVKTSEITNGDPCLNADSLVTYTFTVTNTGGNSSITIASINDALLGGDITASVTLVSGDTNTDGLLNPTETWVYTAPNYTVTQADYDAQSISNTVTINGADVDGTTVTATDTLVIGADQFCDPSNNFAVVKTSEITNGDPCLNADSLVTYTFTVTNTGGNSSITIASINDALLGGDITASVTLVSGDTNTDGLLNPTETWVYTAPNYTVTQADYDAQSISNTVTINGADVDGTTVTATDTLVIGADQFCDVNPGIEIVKDGVFNNDNNNNCSEIDETITYTFTVTNTGNVSLENVIITDPLLDNATPPVVITYVSGDIDNDQEIDLTEIWIYTATYLITQIDIDATEVVNTATVTAEGVANGTIVTSTSQTITDLIEDITPPDTSNCEVLDETIECDGANNQTLADAWNAANILALENCATDECDNNFTVTSDYDFANLVTTCGAGGTITVIYTLTDATGNSSIFTAILTIEDTTAPTFTVPTDVTINCDQDPSDLTLTGDVTTEVDSCSVPLEATYTDAITAGACTNESVITRTWTLVDECNNTTTLVQTITVVDTTAPTFTVPADVTIECSDDENDVTITGDVTDENDNCSSGLEATYTDAVTAGTCANESVITRTWTLVDECNNTTTLVQTITVVDTTAPTFTVPADVTIECSDDENDVTITGDVTDENDNCSSGLEATYTDAVTAGTCANESVITRTWTLVDECNNTTTLVQTITVVDTTAPTFTVPADVTIECSDDENDVTITGDVTDENDNCSSGLEATYTDAVTAGTCANESVITRTWTLVDECNNTTTLVQTITVVDTTAPTFTVPADVTIECSDDENDVTITGDVTDENDNCSSGLEATYTDAVTAGTCANESVITRTWTLVDECNNTTTLVQTITVVDTTAPTFTVPADVTIECSDDENDVTITGDVTDENDNCSSGLEATYTDAVTAGTCANESVITRTWTLVDECNNTTTLVQTITVVDTTAPTFTVPADVTIECSDDENDVTITGDVTDENDNCSSGLEATYTDAVTAGTCANESVITRTWTLVDECNNTTTLVQTITVVDTTAPTFTVPADVTIECSDDENDVTITGDVTDENDNCSSGLEATYTDVVTAGACANESVITRTWTLVDECNNTTTLVQTITVVDTTAPTLITVLDLPNSVICSNVPDVPELIFEDDCSTAEVTVVFDETTTFTGAEEIYDLIWTWTATDDCGNETIITHTTNVITEDFITDLEEEACTDDGLIDLYDYLPEGSDTTIEWVVVTDGITIADGIFDPLEVDLGDYVFTYTVSNNGCLETIRLILNIHDDCILLPCGEEDLKISKAVTPNGDAYNQFFTVGGVAECGFIIDIKIFNRFGDIVYESSDYQNDWSGESPSGSVGSAGRLPNGTYYYVIDIKDSGIKTLSGPIYLGTK